MSTKTKITSAAALAALALPTAALATDGPGKGRGHDRGGDGARSEQHRGDDGRRGHHKGRHHGRHGGRHAFVVAGVSAAGLTVTDGRLAGPITLDPTAANRGAAKLLQLTREKLAGQDTVTFGTAGDGVRVQYKGLAATDALKPTDAVKVYGKVDRATGALDIKQIKVKRKALQG